MRRRTGLLTILALLAGVPLSATAQEPTCPTPEEYAPPPLQFKTPKFIDTARAGGEPVSIVAQDGSISVSAHAGTTHVYKNPEAAGGVGDFAVGYFNQTLNWRSEDGGETWKYVGLLGAEAGPHSATTTGFSDPDFSMDTSGKIYNVEIDLANVSVFSSNDDGQSYALGTPEAGSGDRPWVTGLGPDEVMLYINLPQQLLRSTDGGLTFLPVNTVGLSQPMTSKMLADPLNPTNGLIGPTGGRNSPGGIVLSADDGKTWENLDSPPLGRSTQFFNTPAVDSAGNIYLAAAGGYGGPGDTTPDGEVTFGYLNRATKQWNEEKITIPTPQGDALWPWIVAGDDGRVAVTWYQSLKGKPKEFHIFSAYTLNGQGTWAECSDGSTVFIPPQFSVANSSGRPVHIGDICLQGTTCNLDLGDGGDRRLGDFFTINFTHKGELFIASADTTLESPTGGPKPVGNPIFIKQTPASFADGASMLTQPRTIRPTRCLLNLPTCL